MSTLIDISPMQTVEREPELWRVIEQPNGTYAARVKFPSGTVKLLSGQDRDGLVDRVCHFRELHDSSQPNDEGAFLMAWMNGVYLAGPGLFKQPEGGVAAATSKWDLEPIRERVEAELLERSGWSAVFLAQLCSFYNADWGASLLERTRASTMGDMAAGLDRSRKQVLTTLMLHYQGW